MWGLGLGRRCVVDLTQNKTKQNKKLNLLRRGDDFGKLLYRGVELITGLIVEQAFRQGETGDTRGEDRQRREVMSEIKSMRLDGLTGTDPLGEVGGVTGRVRSRRGRKSRVDF